MNLLCDLRYKVFYGLLCERLHDAVWVRRMIYFVWVAAHHVVWVWCMNLLCESQHELVCQCTAWFMLCVSAGRAEWVCCMICFASRSMNWCVSVPHGLCCVCQQTVLNEWVAWFILRVAVRIAVWKHCIIIYSVSRRMKDRRCCMNGRICCMNSCKTHLPT